MPTEKTPEAKEPWAQLSAAYKNITVCDLSQGIAGPHATMLLAQFGARVIKVEPPAGDWGRSLGRQWGDHCAHSWHYNLGKSSICLDLKRKEGKETLEALVRTADIFVESFRPGVAARLGFGLEDVRRLRPDAIYASLSGFGQSGPNSGRGTVDALIQGFSGMMVMNKTADGAPHRQNMVAVDVMSGLYLFGAIAAALSERSRTGLGSYLDVSMMQSAAAFQAAKIAEDYVTKGNGRGFYGPVGYLPCADGGIVVSCRLPPHFPTLCKVIGCTELIDDPDFATAEARVTNNRALLQRIGERTLNLRLETVLDGLQRAGVLAERVHSYRTWLEDPHVRSVNAFNYVDGGAFGDVPLVHFPGVAPSPLPSRTHAPSLGEHTVEVLESLGVHETQIQSMLAGQAVRAAR